MNLFAGGVVCDHPPRIKHQLLFWLFENVLQVAIVLVIATLITATTNNTTAILITTTITIITIGILIILTVAAYAGFP